MATELQQGNGMGVNQDSRAFSLLLVLLPSSAEPMLCLRIIEPNFQILPTAAAADGGSVGRCMTVPRV